MNVLVAFDKFKDSMDARTACEVTKRVIHELKPDWDVQTAPLADGGEGFCEILTHAADGELETVEVLGPKLTPQIANIGFVDLENVPKSVRSSLNLNDFGKLALIEMAQASGLQSVPHEQRDPWDASTYGTGQLIAHAANKGATAILLGIGGSATNDIGLGALEAIGLEFQDKNRQPLERITPARLEEVMHFCGDVWPHIPPIVIACDVSNPLLGPNGCTQIYGPQKGLVPEDSAKFERAIGTAAKRLCAFFDKPRTLMAAPGAGAAGGISFGLMTACDATLTPGFELVENWLQIAPKVANAQLIITGEGRFDLSSLSGKGPGTIVFRAATRRKATLIFAGALERGLELPELCTAKAVSPENMPLAEALKRGPELLEAAIRRELADF